MSDLTLFQPSRPSVLQASFGDIDEFGEAVSGWHLEWRQLDRGRLRAELLQIESERAAFVHVGFNRQLLQRGSTPVGVRTFGVLGGDVSELRWCGARPVDTDLLSFPRSDYESVSRSGFQGSTLSFPEEHLVEVSKTLGLERVLDRGAEPGSASVCDPRAVRDLRERLRLLARTVCVRPDAARSAAVRHELEFELPASLLEVLASGKTRSHQPPAPRRSRALRRALEFIDAHREEPLRVRDLCEVTGVSWRTLDYAFLDRFGVGPKRYLLSLRLDGARWHLRRAPAGTKVADIANYWGFWHLGKFAADYREQFGELPSQTLGRARPRAHRSGS